MRFSMTYDDLLTGMTAAVQEAGELLRATPRPAQAATFAEGMAAFEAVEAAPGALLRGRLARLRPGAGWAEEWDGSGVPPAEGEQWIVDVIDGAVQYLQGLPQFCVSTALVRDGEPVAAVLYAPLLGETYAAARGRGAARDGRPLVPSGKAEPGAAVVATGQPPFPARQPGVVEAAGRSLTAVLPLVAAVRNLGPTSWQIADTAAGRLDAFWQVGRDATNLLPGALIAREAGAVVTDLEGRPWTAGATGFLAAGPALHGPLLEALAGVGGHG
ncbi:inositol monophosphatase [Streptomyces sp. XM83C]|uniref:inositol monophosphatase family protein n=1 Tax=Streptomyces sp. XM83C TaxID=2929781 RepID=UPI001FF96AAC|nr:inositol monophosphatase family protein [Streptomyces sp. XM83C]MCK1822648.1 inositol monophosphatase [Streptomyces sp. XM83C]